MSEIISTQQAPAAIGPYSQGIMTGNMLFVSGQLPIVPETGEFAGTTIEEQTARSLENVAAILAQAGMNLGNIVKTTIFIKDMNSFAAANGVYAKYFEGLRYYPARACVEVARLPKDALIEIEAIAVK
jgi:2-iminobutanoate/2-iminopropanoate deaminase